MNGAIKWSWLLASQSFCYETVKGWENVFIRLFALAVINMLIYIKTNPEYEAKHHNNESYWKALMHQFFYSLLNPKTFEKMA